MIIRSFLKRPTRALVVALFLPVFSWAQLSLTSLNTNYVIDFDNTVSGVNNGAFAGTGFVNTPSAGQLQNSAFEITGWTAFDMLFGDTNSRVAGDYARGTATGAVGDTGSSAGMYAYNDGGDRSFLMQPAFLDWQNGTMTLRAINNTGTTLTQFAVSYDLFVRNDQSRSQSLNFSYSFDHSTYTPIESFTYNTPQEADLLGRVQVTSVPVSTPYLVTGLEVANGDSIYLQWSSADFAGTGNYDELFLDNITLNVGSASAVPEPNTFALLAGLATLGLVGSRRRRRS